MVFEGLDFSVEPGALLYLRGANGSGKSTLLRLIAGFVPAAGGDLMYGDDAWGTGDAALSEAVVYVGHDHGLKPALTLRENCQTYARIMTGKALSEDALYDAAETFALDRLLDQAVRFFSSGQRHRASLMRFLLADRPVWLMDEPTVGLEADNREKLAGLMTRHLARGGLILAATHDPIGVDGATVDVSQYAARATVQEGWL